MFPELSPELKTPILVDNCIIHTVCNYVLT